MDKIIPVSELRAHLSEITKWVENKKKPVYLTKNGHGRYVLLDIMSYEKLLRKALKNDGDLPFEKHDLDADEDLRRAQTEKRNSSPSQSSPVIPFEERDGRARPQDPGGLTEELRVEEERILKELGLL